jgi:RNA polymerase sigma-70 factor (ECF subfamily)
MLQETDALTVQAGRAGSTGRSDALHDEGKAAKKGRVEQTRNTEAHWVNCMRLVATEQDRKAFSELFAHFAPRVKAFLMKSGADASMAEECSQDVLATVWRKSHLFDPSRASVATWIFTIARNRRIDALRKERRPEPEELTWGPEAEPDQADAITMQQESAQLAQAIAELPDKQRELIEKAYFGDLSHSEIAVATGLPLGTIKSRIRLALERLRHMMT